VALEVIDNAIREARPLTSADSGTGVVSRAGGALVVDTSRSIDRASLRPLRLDLRGPGTSGQKYRQPLNTPRDEQ